MCRAGQMLAPKSATPPSPAGHELLVLLFQLMAILLLALGLGRLAFSTNGSEPCGLESLRAR